MPQITHVTSPDWEGIYVDGKLKRQNHALDTDEVLKAIGIDFKTIEADDQWLYEEGQLPEDLADVKEAPEES